MATRQEVSQFLNEVAAAVSFGHVRWITRADTTQNLIDLNITQSIAEEVIQQLTPDNYSHGLKRTEIVQFVRCGYSV